MLIDIPAEILKIIINCSDSRSAYNLKCTCKYINTLNTKFNIVKRRLIENVDKTLYKYFGGHLSKNLSEGQFGEHVNEFKGALEASGGVISGSLLTQCLLDVEWEDGDIDIYIPGNNEISPTLTALEKFIYNSPKSFYLREDSWTRYKRGVRTRSSKITWMRSYEVKGKKIQIIQVSDVKYNPISLKDIVSFINSSFDFNFTKNTYYIENSTPHITIGNITELRDRTFNFRYTSSLIDSMKRANKYISRGFNMTNNITFEKVGEYFLRRSLNVCISESGKQYICIPDQDKSERFHKKKISTLKHLPCDNSCPFVFFKHNCKHVHINWTGKNVYIPTILIIHDTV